jgi:hypothetical protein
MTDEQAEKLGLNGRNREAIEDLIAQEAATLMLFVNQQAKFLASRTVDQTALALQMLSDQTAFYNMAARTKLLDDLTKEHGEAVTEGLRVVANIEPKKE